VFHSLGTRHQKPESRHHVASTRPQNPETKSQTLDSQRCAFDRFLSRSEMSTNLQGSETAEDSAQPGCKTNQELKIKQSTPQTGMWYGGYGYKWPNRADDYCHFCWCNFSNASSQYYGGYPYIVDDMAFGPAVAMESSAGATSVYPFPLIPYHMNIQLVNAGLMPAH
jgi:hypothetical protein